MMEHASPRLVLEYRSETVNNGVDCCADFLFFGRDDDIGTFVKLFTTAEELFDARGKPVVLQRIPL
jgi:hypothetical protein